MLRESYSKHEKNIEYLLLKRTKDRGDNWDYLTGGMKIGEMPTITTIREVLEETSFVEYKLFRYINHVRCFYIDEESQHRYRDNASKCFGSCFIIEIKKQEPSLNYEHSYAAKFCQIAGVAVYFEYSQDALAEAGALCIFFIELPQEISCRCTYVLPSKSVPRQLNASFGYGIIQPDRLLIYRY